VWSNQVLIIGAGGMLGGLTARAFRTAGWQVRCAARRPRDGQLGLDLSHVGSVARVLRATELVVNTVPHPGLLAERAVLEHGGMLINTSTLPASAGRSLRAIAGGAQGTVLMNAGLAPGVTSLVATDLLRRHPEAEELEIVFSLSTGTPRAPASADFVHHGLAGVPQHRTALVPLPQPFGERRCLGFDEVDAGWLGGIAEGRLVRSYLCILERAAHEWLLGLNRAGAMTTLPRSLFTAGPQCGRPTRPEPVAHWVAVCRRERRLAARTIQCTGGVIHAARSTVAFAEAMCAREPRGGCFDPEELFTLAELESNLRASGIRIVDQTDPEPPGGRLARLDQPA
jgi:hypothetical protein